MNLIRVQTKLVSKAEFNIKSAVFWFSISHPSFDASPPTIMLSVNFFELII